MKKKLKGILLITLAAAILISLAACSGNNKESLNVGFLKGPTGVGAAWMMKNTDALSAEYSFTVEADPSAINSALVSGALDIAAVPTNAAVSLYNKTGGGVKVIAINTMGVLHILENGSTISSLADLKGRTVYATGQGSNPEYILNYLLRENGLEPGEDVSVEYLASDELTVRMASGELQIGMLPVPAATSVVMKNKDVRSALDLTEEWEKTFDDGSELIQGCIVAGASVPDAAIKAFLKDYEKSINFMKDEANLETAAALCEEFRLVGSAEIAKAAIPDCGLTFISGRDNIKKALSDSIEVLFEANPSSIGGNLPDDEFYYG